MKEMELYSLWTKTELEDTDLSEELAAIAGDTEAIKDRFYRDLEFGTGGLRGVLGAGTNRMNIKSVGGWRTPSTKRRNTRVWQSAMPAVSNRINLQRKLRGYLRQTGSKRTCTTI